jgi:nucleoside-diphosphate-sugar epimerase
VRLLVAGATGQLGAGLLEVMGEEGCTMVPLVRGRPPARGSGRLHPPDPALVDDPVHGDVRLPRWGLDDGTVERLAATVDAVINLAGQTNWAGRGSDLFDSHVLGARHGRLLAREFAARTGRRVPYVYAGSVYAAGGAIGEVPERPYPPGADRTTYEQAKWLAERRLLEPGATTGATGATGATTTDDAAPLLILRVSALVGNSRTGRTLRRNSLYMLADRWADLPGGVLPAMPGARVDALPRDVAAAAVLRALRGAVERPPDGPVICHLGLGESAPSLRGLLDIAWTGDPMRFRRPPRVVPSTARQIVWFSQNVHRFVPLSPHARNLLIGLRYIGLDRVFARPRLAALLGGDVPAVPVERLAALIFGTAPRGLDLPGGDLPGEDRAMARFTG